ncbi:hypothetical protein ATANTOWER_002001 [Ataeniobius toweri]|uniref:Uncharacterized protein n=1 Tax=Ataeniobius toweri TaxID=208326 RepID=A0ABU7A4S2_9TELE|nr:hypothetical protein [Ataeniobius toweri]
MSSSRESGFFLSCRKRTWRNIFSLLVQMVYEVTSGTFRRNVWRNVSRTLRFSGWNCFKVFLLEIQLEVSSSQLQTEAAETGAAEFLKVSEKLPFVVGLLNVGVVLGQGSQSVEPVFVLIMYLYVHSGLGSSSQLCSPL